MNTASVQRLLQRSLARALGGAMHWRARLTVWIANIQETLTMNDDLNAASEALVAMPLPTMLKSLGLAVAEANKALAEVKGPNSAVMAVQEATIDLSIAISVNKSEDLKVGGALALQAFNVNAGYARTFGFKEEASSRISMKIVVKTPG